MHYDEWKHIQKLRGTEFSVVRNHMHCDKWYDRESLSDALTLNRIAHSHDFKFLWIAELRKSCVSSGRVSKPRYKIQEKLLHTYFRVEAFRILCYRIYTHIPYGCRVRAALKYEMRLCQPVKFSLISPENMLDPKDHRIEIFSARTAIIVRRMQQNFCKSSQINN